MGFDIPGYRSDCRRVRVYGSGSRFCRHCKGAVYHFLGVIPDFSGHTLVQRESLNVGDGLPPRSPVVVHPKL